MPSLAYGFTILVDPGHGGEDDGARARFYYGKKKWKMVNEKDIALSLSKRSTRNWVRKRLNPILQEV